MYVIDNDSKQISVTRGDILSVKINAKIGDEDYEFQTGDILRFKIMERKNPKKIYLQKDEVVESDTEIVQLDFDSNETKFGQLINKPKDYWYEVELNPETAPQTIIGYDEDGEKLFNLYPEGSVIR